MTTSNSYLASFFHLFVLFLWDNFTAKRCKLLLSLLVELDKVKVKIADEKTCMSSGVPQRPPNPAVFFFFLKTRIVHFSTLFKTRHHHIMEFIFLGKKFWYLECRPVIAINHTLLSLKEAVFKTLNYPVQD